MTRRRRGAEEERCALRLSFAGPTPERVGAPARAGGCRRVAVACARGRDCLPAGELFRGVAAGNGERRMAKHPYCPLSNCPRSFVPRLAQACAETGSGSSQAANGTQSTWEAGIAQPGGNAAGVRGIGRAGGGWSWFWPAAATCPRASPGMVENLKVSS